MIPIVIHRDVPSLYDALVAAGVPLDSHESDLYVKATPEADRVLAPYLAIGHSKSISRFRSDLDGAIWYELPFMYAPFWETVTRRTSR